MFFSLILISSAVCLPHRGCQNPINNAPAAPSVVSVSTTTNAPASAPTISAQPNGQCPGNSTIAIPAQCNDAKTSTSPKGGPDFAPFDNVCKGTGFITFPSTKDEECCTGCSDGKACRAPNALQGVQTCRDGTAPDFTNGLRFIKKPVSDPSCGGKPTDPACGI